MKTSAPRFSHILLLLLCLAASVRAQNVAQIYLKLDNVIGGATDVNFKSQIVGTGFSFSITNGSARLGAVGGAASFGNLVFSKYVDIASPVLALGAASGTAYQQATISFLQPVQGTETVTYLIVLKNVIVAGLAQTAATVATAANPAGNPTEAVALSYGSIQWEVGSIKAGFNLQTNAKLDVTTNAPPHDIQARFSDKALAANLPALPLK